MNNNLRVFWIIWCSAWALGWATIGWFIFPINLIMIPLSLACIIIPVGTSTSYTKHTPPTPYDYPSSVYDTRFTREQREAYFGVDLDS